MKQVGFDLGTSTVKIVVIDNNTVIDKWIKAHCGKIIETVEEGIRNLNLHGEYNICVTGANRKNLINICSELSQVEDIPAIVEGVRFLEPSSESIIEIGSQSARFITDIKEKSPRFSINEHCAGGTGSFFEDQMSRLGLQMKDYSTLVSQAREIPNLSGRCAVFAKTDIIHRQQEGVPKQDILLGLCYAMIRNYKATIVKTLPVKKPITFCGGVTSNLGVIKAIKDIFKLKENELIIPSNALYSSAIGAAISSSKAFNIDNVLSQIESYKIGNSSLNYLPQLKLLNNVKLKDPECTHIIPSEGAYLGIDVGSTSTDLVLVSADGALIDFQYLRTAGEPEKVVRHGMAQIKEKYGDFKILGVGITGSGRERLGRMMAADAIKDEITAQAKAAVSFVPDVDTVFEIGGQDSKFISIKDKEVVDFQMNKICAAGTGSFIEEQAARMNIPIEEFGSIALNGENPCDLGERCTVFIETAITNAQAQGATTENIAAGLCHSIVKNYLHKVVGSKHVGKKIVLQGGVDYNPGIVAAFQSEYGNNITVSPVFSISGAYGAAMLSKEAVRDRESTFLGFDFPCVDRKIKATSEEIRKNKAFYRKAGQLAVEDYDGRIDPNKKTIGVPLTLIMFKFFPLANAFFKSLGYNVVLSHPSNEETIELSQQYAQGETCYPVKLLYGHMMQLANQKVDYIFLPRIHTIRHPNSHAVHNYACPYMQMAAKAVFDNLELEKKGIKLLSPILDLDLGAQMMGMAMLETGKALGFSKPRCLPGLLKGAKAVLKYSAGVEKLGREILSSLKPDDKVLVLITRNYGISDPILNMGIPELLLQKGYKVITLGHLPGMDLDVSSDYPHMYWPFGDHILSGAKLIANHPNLYAVYLTNHGCGPDTIISHMFKEEMGDKPYLQIEVDEHYSKVGVITRVEAFLNSISHREPAKLPENFDILNVKMNPANITDKPQKGKKLYIPDLGLYTKYIAEYYKTQGFETYPMHKFDRRSLTIGRAQMNSKEYLPLPMLVGSCIRTIEENGKDEDLQFLIPFTYGADADGQYARTVRTILDRLGYKNCCIVAPMLEEIPDNAYDFDLLLRAVLTGDVLYSLDIEKRKEFSPDTIPSIDGLIELAKNAQISSKKAIGIVGEPFSITSLDEGVFDSLYNEGYRAARMPLSEMLWFLWKDNNRNIDKSMLDIVSNALGKSSTFSKDADNLLKIADRYLDAFAGNNGRYRYAKAVDMGNMSDAVILASPRYENTAMVLSLFNVHEVCNVPLFELSFDGDWDESELSRLKSFLYYCK